MNLSALNTGLNQATVNNSPEVNTSGSASLRLPTGSLSGEDFAAFLRNQVRALKNSQRPDIAAAPQVKALPPAEHTAPAADHEDTHIDDNRSNKLKSQDKQTARQAREEDDSAQAKSAVLHMKLAERESKSER